MTANRQWRLASYPDGMPVESNWSLAEAPVPEPGRDEMLVRAIYLDVAPYMRGRISPQKNYAAGVSLGDVMIGGGIGEVVRSNSKDYKAGDIVVTDHSFGWQEHALVRPGNCRRVDPQVAPLPYWLDALGMNGMTAYFALYDCARRPAGRHGAHLCRRRLRRPDRGTARAARRLPRRGHHQLARRRRPGAARSATTK